MALQNQTPTTTPAIAEKTLPDLWLSNISIAAPSLTAGRITIETLPYNESAQELGSGQDMVTISTDELWLAVSEVPEVAQAMGAIFAAIDPLRDWVAAREALKAQELND